MAYEQELNQIQQTRQAIEQRKQEFAQARQQLQGTNTRLQPLTNQQLFGATPQSQAARLGQEAFLGKQKEQSLNELSLAERNFQEQINPIESQLSVAQDTIQQALKQQEAYTVAMRYASRDKYPMGETPAVLKAYQEIKAGLDSQAAYRAEISKLSALGLKPVFSNGKIAGFEDTVAGKSYAMENLPSMLERYRPGDIPSFEKAGLITTTQVPINQTLAQAQQQVNDIKLFGMPNNVQATRAIPQRVTIGGGAYSQPQYVNFQTFGPESIANTVDKISLFGDEQVTKATEKLGLGDLTIPQRTIPMKQTISYSELKVPELKVPVSKVTGDIFSMGIGVGAAAVPLFGEAYLISSAARGLKTGLSKGDTMSRVGGFLEAGTSLGFLGLGGIKGLVKPREVKLFNLEPKTESLFIAQPVEMRGKSFLEVMPITERTTPRVQTYTTLGREAGNLLKTTIGRTFPTPSFLSTPLPRFRVQLEPRVEVATMKGFEPVILDTKGTLLGQVTFKDNVMRLKPAEVELFKASKTKSYIPSTKTSLLVGETKAVDTSIENALASKTSSSVLQTGRTSPYGKVKNIDLFTPEAVTKRSRQFRSIEIGKTFPTKKPEITGVKAFSYQKELLISPSGRLARFGEPSRIKVQGLINKPISLGPEVNRIKRPSKNVDIFYHGTSDKFTNKILKEGLKPSSKTGIYQGIANPLDFVSAGTSKETALGFATRTALKKGGKPVVLEIRIPKSKTSSLSMKSEKLSGVGEMRFKYVPAQNIVDPFKLTKRQARQAVSIAAQQASVFKKLPKVTRIKSPSSPSYRMESSLFYGKGQYEKSSGGLLPGEKQILLPRTSMSTLESSNEKSANKLESSLGMVSLNKMKFGTASESPSRSSQNFAQVPDVKLRQTPIQVTPQKSVERTRPVNRQANVPFLTTTPITGIRTPNIKIPPGKSFNFKSPNNRRTDLLGSKQSKGGGFIPLLRRRGKFMAIGKPTTFEKAFGIGKQEARRTLGASVRVMQVGKGFVKLPATEEFRYSRSRKDPFSVVQKTRQRLVTPSERREIVLSRRKGGIKFF